MKNIKGFTLIELIVVLGLAGIVMSVVMSFFITNYKSYETINTESEVQYQSQYIINFMTNKILAAESFEGKTGNKFIFKYEDEDEGEITATFELDEENNKIKYTYDTEPPVDIGKYVKKLIIEPNGTNISEVKITLILEKGNDEEGYKAEQVVYMRNSKN